MSVIEGVLLEERDRNLMMQNQYLQEISTLPKGSIVKKSNKSGVYYYLAYRKGNKVVSDYLGKDAQKVQEIQQNIDKRKYLEASVKNLKNELKLIAKVAKSEETEVRKVPEKPYTIAELQRLIKPVAVRYGVRRVLLFGSYARGEATLHSDIDLRIDNGAIKDYFELSGFQQELEAILSGAVDVLTTGSLEDKFLSRIADEEVILYEQSQH